MKSIDISGDAIINWSAGIYDSDRTRLTIALMHVRAANDIEIEYNADRDGWVVYATVTLGRKDSGKGYDESIEERREKAFIPAWDADEVDA